MATRNSGSAGSEPSVTNPKTQNAITQMLSSEINLSTSSSPIAIPTRSSGSANFARSPPLHTNYFYHRTITRQSPALSVLQSNCLEPSVSPNSNDLFASSTSPKSPSIPQRVIDIMKAHGISPTGSPDVLSLAGSPSPAASRPNSAQSRSHHSSVSSPPDSKTNRELSDFNANAGSLSSRGEFPTDEEDLSLPGHNVERACDSCRTRIDRS